jgi:cadmium resistance protein CadD (predicted permease)
MTTMHNILFAGYYLGTVILVVASLRARYRLGPNYSIARVRLIGIAAMLAGIGTAALAIISMRESGRSQIEILRLLAGFQLVLAGVIFWHAATHRPFLHQ